MSKLKDLFSLGKKSASPKDGSDAPSKDKDKPAGDASSPEKPSRFKLPPKLAAFVGALPNLKDLFSSQKQLVGLDIGSGMLKVAEVLPTKTGHYLNYFNEIALDKGVIEEGVLADPDALTENVKALLKGTGLQRKALVVSLSGHAAIVKKVTFPDMGEADMREMIHDEAGKYLPFDNMDDVNYDFQILGSNEFNATQMDVMLVAAKKDVITDFVEALESAGMMVMIMDVDTFCLETVYEANYDFDPNDVVVLVNIGASITNINVLKGNMSVFTRDFTLAGNAITEAVASSYNLSFEAAEAMKIDGPDGDDLTRDAFRNSLLSYADPILTEIERSIDYFRSTSGGENIKKILLSGGVAATPGIAGDLTQRLGIETEILDPFRKIEYNKKTLTAERIEEIRPIAAVAVGLALRKVGDK
jgi:type IV pilus assembly protein PilM